MTCMTTDRPPHLGKPFPHYCGHRRGCAICGVSTPALPGPPMGLDPPTWCERCRFAVALQAGTHELRAESKPGWTPPDPAAEVMREAAGYRRRGDVLSGKIADHLEEFAGRLTAEPPAPTAFPVGKVVFTSGAKMAVIKAGLRHQVEATLWRAIGRHAVGDCGRYGSVEGPADPDPDRPDPFAPAAVVNRRTILADRGDVRSLYAIDASGSVTIAVWTRFDDGVADTLVYAPTEAAQNPVLALPPLPEDVQTPAVEPPPTPPRLADSIGDVVESRRRAGPLDSVTHPTLPRHPDSIAPPITRHLGSGARP